MKDLVTSLLQCSSEPENWGVALDSFKATFETSATCMFSVSEFHDPSVNFHWCNFFRDSLTPDVLALMENGGDAGDRPAYEFLFESPTQKFYPEITSFGVDKAEDLPKSAVREITKSYGFVMRSSAVLNRTGPWMDAIFCQHRTDAEWQSFVSDSRTDIILPIAANSLSLSRTLQALRTRFQASLAVLDALGLAVFLVDGTGCVIEHNKEAQRILDAADGLSIARNKRLKLQLTEKTAELETLIAAANDLLNGEVGKANSLMVSPRPSGAYEYLLSVYPLADSRAELEVGFKCAFVTVIDPSRKNVLSTKGISTLGQLSKAESEVVELLLQGLRPSEAAERRNVRPNTIKSQLKTITQKLRCSTQSDIIRVAAATHVPIDQGDDLPDP